MAGTAEQVKRLIENLPTEEREKLLSQLPQASGNQTVQDGGINLQSILNLAENGNQIKKDMREVNGLYVISKDWLKRRNKLVPLLNDTADSLSQLNKNKLTFDVVGTSVSILGGVVASIALTGGAALPLFLAGAGQVGGTVTSLVAQEYKDRRTKELLAELNEILKEDAEDMIEIRRLMKTFEHVEQRLNKFLPILNKVVQIGIVAVQGLIKITSVGQEKALTGALYSIKNIITDDNVITFLNRHGSVPSADIPASTTKMDWTSEIYVFKFILGVSNMALPLVAPRMLAPVRCAGGLTETGASVLESSICITAKTTFVLLNLLAIAIDVLHLVQIKKTGEKEERYIKQMREVAKELQNDIDKMQKRNIK